MTHFTAPFTTRFTAITSNPSNIDWAQTGRTLLGWLYNVAVVVGVAFYLCYLACEFSFNLGCTVRGLWIKYEITAKLAAAKAAIAAEFKALPGLSVRFAEVKAAYALFGGKVTSTFDAMKADYSAMRGH